MSYNSNILLLGFLLTINVRALTFTIGTTKCSCDQITIQADCPNYAGCEWSTNNICQSIDCTKKGKTVEECNKLVICALNTTSACEAKAACSTYKYDAKTSCNMIGCDAGELDSTTNQYPCKDYTNVFDASKACSTYDETDCEKAGCRWSSQCGAPTCVIYDKDNCKYIRTADNQNTRVICQWDSTNSACVESTTGLDATNCQSYTSGTYLWDQDSSTCLDCSSEQSSQIIITIALSLILALF